MGRLTKNYSGDYCAEDVNEWEITCKLGHLEDLEDELGISLEVLFKALKEGIYNRNGYIDYVYLDYALLEGKYCLITTDDRVFKLEYYGKTWGLTKEEIKNEEEI